MTPIVQLSSTTRNPRNIQPHFGDFSISRSLDFPKSRNQPLHNALRNSQSASRNLASRIPLSLCFRVPFHLLARPLLPMSSCSTFQVLANLDLESKIKNQKSIPRTPDPPKRPNAQTPKRSLTRPNSPTPEPETFRAIACSSFCLLAFPLREPLLCLHCLRCVACVALPCLALLALLALPLFLTSTLTNININPTHPSIPSIPSFIPFFRSRLHPFSSRFVPFFLHSFHSYTRRDGIHERNTIHAIRSDPIRYHAN